MKSSKNGEVKCRVEPGGVLFDNKMGKCAFSAFSFIGEILSGATKNTIKNKRVLPETDKTSVCFDLSVKNECASLPKISQGMGVVI